MTRRMIRGGAAVAEFATIMLVSAGTVYALARAAGVGV